MRSIARVLGTVGAVAVLALGITQSASAAQGQLIIGSTTYNNPTGCFPVGSLPAWVQNHTTGYAFIYSGPGCTQFVIQVVGPGQTALDQYGQSVFVQ
jgi:hypothetical protein